MSDKSIIEQVKHYQKDIVKCPGDTKRMIRCIERLTILPVTIAHLQETGVGRSVNELRKCGGQVGAAASSLVYKWKSMVKADDSEESDTQETNKETVSTSVNSNSLMKRNESSQKPKSVDHSSDRYKKVPSAHSHSKPESRHHEMISTKEHSSHKHLNRSQEKSDSSTTLEYSDSRKSISNKSKSHHTRRNLQKHDSGDEYSLDKNTKTDQHKSGKINNKSDLILSEDSKHIRRKDKPRYKDESNSQRNSKKYDRKKRDSDYSDDDIYKTDRTKHKICSEEKGHDAVGRKRLKIVSKIKESSDESDSKSETEEKFHIEPANDSDSDYGKQKDMVSDSDCSVSNHGDNAVGNDEDCSESDSEEKYSDANCNSSGDEDEYVPVKIKKEKESPVREVESTKTEKTHLKHSKIKSNFNSKVVIKQEKEESSKTKKDQFGKSNTNTQRKKESSDIDKRHTVKRSKSHSKTSSKHNKVDKKVKVKIEKEEDGSIDCVSGASFADALLGLSDTKKKTVKKKANSSQDKSPTVEEVKSVMKMKKDVASSNRRSLPSTSSTDISFKEPDLLSKKIKLEPLDVNLNATLPEINPNYKPLPHFSPPPSPPHKRAKIVSQEEALSKIITTKNLRTKVYSGNKSCYTKVPSLFDLCIQLLQNNIEGLEYTGGVPYDLLKPVLDRATAEQLHQLEYYNPYLVEDTDNLWQFHCKKEFRGREPDEFETWRELYMRLLDERELKLKALKENITQSMAKSTPLRQTKLAYIDSVVKPPRNVARQQMKMGTGKALKHDIVSKAMVGAAGSSPAPPPVSVPAPPRVSSSNSSLPIPNFLKKKKAPLMAKALQLIKGNRFKR